MINQESKFLERVEGKVYIISNGGQKLLPINFHQYESIDKNRTFWCTPIIPGSYGLYNLAQRNLSCHLDFNSGLLSESEIYSLRED